MKLTIRSIETILVRVMLANRPELEEGMFTLPDGPGFGWELDGDFVQKYRVDV